MYSSWVLLLTLSSVYSTFITYKYSNTSTTSKFRTKPLFLKKILLNRFNVIQIGWNVFVETEILEYNLCLKYKTYFRCMERPLNPVFSLFWFSFLCLSESSFNGAFVLFQIIPLLLLWNLEFKLLEVWMIILRLFLTLPVIPKWHFPISICLIIW